MTCYTCGRYISCYKEAFDKMREVITIQTDQKNPTHVAKRTLDTDLNVMLIDAFEALRIKEYCCRKILTSSINFHDLEYQ